VWTRLVAGALVLATLGAAGVWLVHQPFLRVNHVRVTGVRHESLAAVLAASGLASHPPMIDVNAAEIDRRLAGFAWIRDVRLTRRWPDTVVVQVREREAVAVAFDAAHQLQYVDANGRDLGSAPLHANLPTLRATGASGPWPFRRAGRGAAYVASRLPPAFTRQVSVISEGAGGAITLQMTTPVRFVLGPPTNLEAKFSAIASVIAHSRLSPGDIVDVSVPGALAVTGAPPS
jgi:cell division protein FtsQ